MAEAHEKQATPHRLFLWALSALIAGTVVLVNLRHHLFSHDAAGTEATLEGIEATGYRWLTAGGYREHRARFVHLVLLDKKTEGEAILGNLCNQREFLSVVVENLIREGVSGVVLDLHFGGKTCTNAKDYAQSQRLVQSLTDAVVPVTIGVKSTLVPEGETSLSLAESNLFDPLRPPGNVQPGLIRANHDTRKIPLEWDVSVDGAVRPFRGLAYAAAVRSSPALSHDLESFLAERRHPYASFIKLANLPSSAAAAVYCLDPRVRFEGIDCTRFPAPKNLRGTIALVGHATDDDHESPMGRVPGVALHANYIEALLDQRYFKPVAPWYSLPAIAFAFFLIKRQFWKTNHRNRLLVCCVVSLGVVAISAYAILIQFQIILPFVFDLGGLLIFTLISWLDASGHGLEAHPPEEPTRPQLSSGPDPVSASRLLESGSPKVLVVQGVEVPPAAPSDTEPPPSDPPDAPPPSDSKIIAPPGTS